MDTEGVICKSTLTVGQYEINIKVIQDYHSLLIEQCDSYHEVKYNPLPLNDWKETDFTLDNSCHNAYFTVDSSWHDKKYFVLSESVTDLQSAFSKMGYARHPAWLKAIDSLKYQAKYIQGFYNDEWVFVGIEIAVIKRKTDRTGLMWSANITDDYNALWGIEWSTHGSIIDNKQCFNYHVPDLLPNCITLTEDQLNTMWNDLE